MRIALYLIAALVLGGCAAATESPTTPEAPSVAVVAPKPAPSSPPADVPGPAHVEDFPASCVAARFTATGTHMTDATTGLTWIATDVAYQPSPTATPVVACGFDGGGFRPATTAEVLAIATAIPGCTLPGLMHAVYAWAPNAKAAGPMPVVTSDGCVDVKAGVSFAGACHLEDVVDEASTLCVK